MISLKAAKIILQKLLTGKYGRFQAGIVRNLRSPCSNVTAVLAVATEPDRGDPCWMERWDDLKVIHREEILEEREAAIHLLYIRNHRMRFCAKKKIHLFTIMLIVYIDSVCIRWLINTITV